jgi:hypothetical protein
MIYPFELIANLKFYVCFKKIDIWFEKIYLIRDTMRSFDNKFVLVNDNNN